MVIGFESPTSEPKRETQSSRYFAQWMDPMVVFTKVRLTTDPFRKIQRRGKLNCLLASFFGADADGVLDRTDKNFSIANLSGLGGFYNRIHGSRDLAVR